MKRAGVDIDGVLYDWDVISRELIGMFWGVEIPERSTTYYYVWQRLQDRLGKSTGDLAWSWLFTAPARQAGLWTDGHPIAGALDAVRRLSLHYEIAIITKRPRVAIADTYHWITRIARLLPDSVTILAPDSGRTKAEVVCDWYVDDDPRNIKDLVAAGRTAYLLDQPWNQDDDGGGIRVANWDDLLDRVKPV